MSQMNILNFCLFFFNFSLGQGHTQFRLTLNSMQSRLALNFGVALNSSISQDLGFQAYTTMSGLLADGDET